ncbi:surface antigen-domain-containing protein [Zychaea mexicana]|uniref:surface antigen-domain-containing protein n=1 Tax=Zychaea mexicana TaxID=64656 RepID=UPI0022FE6B5E|nr:surface antigen-domain-containing protein [Zychaea mexicana]KAI9498481.1 surface antigen-domain-containing protein [Zychaea mexicana]
MDPNLDISEQQRAAARRLFGVLSATAGSPAHVNAVTILGAKATRPGFLTTVTQPVIDSKTVADVVNQSQAIAEQLIRLDIFEDVQVLLDRATDTDPLAAPGSINVLYQVKEKSRVFLKTGTEIGNNEGNMNGSITVRNVLGGAEMLESSASFGTRNSSAFQFALSKPIQGSPDAKVDINAHSVVQNNTLYSSYEEVAKGAGLRYRGVSRYGYHELGLDCTWRNIDRIADTASLSIRQQAGHTLKTSIRHVFMHDRRDNMLLPSTGHYVKCTQELAGGFGNTKFFKTQLETQYCHRIGGGQLLKDSEGQWTGVHPGLVLSMGLRAGFMAAESATVSDKFMLGGPLSIRGFRTAGVGPRDYRDALGGDAYWAAGFSAISPLPKYEDKPLRAHAFVNAGTLVPWKIGTNAQDTARSLIQSPSVAVGFGLIYRHSIARLELNYCIPLTAARGDLVKRGLQLGVGIDFL